jgi:hypothetical protein
MREALVQEAHELTLKAFENARLRIEDLMTTIHSAEVEAMRAQYLAKLQERFDEACEQVEPAARKDAERRLKEIHQEIAEKEAVLNPPENHIDSLKTTAELFEFLESSIEGRVGWGDEWIIESSHKMEWARQLCKILEEPKKDTGYEELKSILTEILKTAGIHNPTEPDSERYVKRFEINQIIKLTEDVFTAVDK